MSVLIIAPHPDDEAIGCGGAILNHLEDGDRVLTVFLTSGEAAHPERASEVVWSVREAEARSAARVLGTPEPLFLRLPDGDLESHVERAAAALRPILEQERPEVIYLPHQGENHPDHVACLPIIRAALRASGIPAPDLWGYEVWTPLTEYDNVLDITSVMAGKLRAVRCYHSQLESFRYDRAARGLNQYRGALAAACPYAEVFLWLDPSDEE